MKTDVDDCDQRSSVCILDAAGITGLTGSLCGLTMGWGMEEFWSHID